MNNLDIRTIFVGYSISNAICAVVIGFLWSQNHKRYPGLGFWFANFIMQFATVILVALRGLVPEIFSVVLANVLSVLGMLLLYIGMELFVGKVSAQRYNYLMLLAFTIIHIYYTFFQPNLTGRSDNFSIATLLICAQIAWLLLRRVDAEWRPMTRSVGILSLAIVLVNLIRIMLTSQWSPGTDFLNSGVVNALTNLVFQMLYIGITFALFLMVNQRLVNELMNDIAERKLAEQEHEISKEKFRRLSEATFEAIIITEKGICIGQNQAAEKMFGFTSEQALGRNGYEWMAPADRELVKKNILEGYEEPYDATALRKDGTTFPCRVRGKTLLYQEKDVRFTSITDLTAQREADKALRDVNFRLQSIIEGTQVGTWEWNVQTGEVVLNEVWARMLGYTLDELAPISIDTWETFAHPDDLLVSNALLKKHFSGELENYSCESRMKHKDGHWIWVYDRGRVITRANDG